MAVALAALFVALGGTAFAAVVAANSVNSTSIINGAVKRVDIANGAVGRTKIAGNAINSAKVANGSLSAADLSTAAKTQIRSVRWALVNKDHTAILAQSGGISIASTYTGGIYLDMGADVSGRAILATNAYLDDDGNTKGSIIATICGGAPYGGTCGGSGTNDTNHVWAYTQTTDNTAGENHAFYVVVL